MNHKTLHKKVHHSSAAPTLLSGTLQSKLKKYYSGVPTYIKSKGESGTTRKSEKEKELLEASSLLPLLPWLYLEFVYNVRGSCLEKGRT